MPGLGRSQRPAQERGRGEAGQAGDERPQHAHRQPEQPRDAQARAATSAMLVASTATVNTSPLTGDDPAASTASSGPLPFGLRLGP